MERAGGDVRGDFATDRGQSRGMHISALTRSYRGGNFSACYAARVPGEGEALQERRPQGCGRRAIMDDFTACPAESRARHEIALQRTCERLPYRAPPPRTTRPGPRND